MKTVVFTNQKGGTGKSALSCHLAFYAGEQGLRVLFGDFDSQGNSTRNLLDDISDQALRSSDLFLSKHPSALPQPSKSPGVSVIVGDSTLNAVDENAKIDETRPAAFLRSLVTEYDLCIIDTPPTLGKRLRAALVAADCVVVPFQPARESVDGVGDLLQTIDEIRSRDNPSLRIAGFLANRVNRQSKSDRELIALMSETVGELLLPHQITERTRIKDSLAGLHPVWHHQRGGSDRTAANEMKLTMESVLERVL